MNAYQSFPATLRPTVIFDDFDFDLRLSALGPFERQPHLAVAVSGGADSLCLTLMASRWAARRGGRVTALSVNHGLRAEARGEVEQVCAWLRPKGIDHRILSWYGEKPVTGLQAAARNARYNLMTEWCRNASVLHLLLAHTLDDQAETFLLRLQKGSGVEGLSAMAEIRENPSVRLLRPLLGVRKMVLRAALKIEGQEWIEDPSNCDAAFARVRVRQAMLDGCFDAEALAQSANRFGRARLALETSICKLLACSSLIHPAGFAVLNPKEIFSPPGEVGMRALGRVVSAIGGNNFSPRMDKLERLYKDILDVVFKEFGFPARTLGGCRIMIGNGKYRGRILICREVRGLPKSLLVKANKRLVWDRRFQIQFSSTIQPGSRLAALGEQDWLKISSHDPKFRNCGIPGPVRLALPALFDKKGVYSVPHLGFFKLNGPPDIKKIRFYPPISISRAGFFLR